MGKKRNETAADPQAIVQDILTSAGATKEHADWKTIAQAARDAYAKAETSLSECATRTYFYACAWGGFRGHMGQWSRIVRGETAIEDHVQRPLDGDEPRARTREPEPEVVHQPRRAKTKQKPAAPEPKPAAPATITDDDIEAWLREENR